MVQPSSTAMVETDLALSVNSISSLVEQLGKALAELQSEKGFALDNLQLQEALEHFHGLETLIFDKFLAIEIREKALQHEESEAQMVIASKEADITAKEQDLLDRIQELKDAAFATIAEARAKHPILSFESVSAEDSENSQVRISLDDKEALLSGPGEKNGEKAQSLSDKVEPRPELVKLCEQMDANGLLAYFMDNQTNIPSIFEELILALESATEPAQLVLTSLQGFYASDESNQKDMKNDAAFHGKHNSCLMIMKAMANLLVKADPTADHILSPEIKQQAKAFADEWKPKLAGNSMDPAAGLNSLEVEAFLQLLATFRISSEFDKEELCELVFSVPHLWEGPELCRSLELTHKMPGLVEALIRSGRQIEATRFIHHFQLTERYPLIPLIKAYLKNLRRNIHGQPNANVQELAALRAVLQCIEEYELQEDYYQLSRLHTRLDQLENWERKSESRANAGSRGFSVPDAGFKGQTASRSAMSVGYPHAVPSPYDFPAANQPSYPHAQRYDDDTSYYAGYTNSTAVLK